MDTDTSNGPENTTAPGEDEIVGNDAAAKYVGVSVNTWYPYVSRGQAPAPHRREIRGGHAIPVWTRAALDAFKNRQHRPGTRTDVPVFTAQIEQLSPGRTWELVDKPWQIDTTGWKGKWTAEQIAKMVADGQTKLPHDNVDWRVCIWRGAKAVGLPEAVLERLDRQKQQQWEKEDEDLRRKSIRERIRVEGDGDQRTVMLDGKELGEIWRAHSPHRGDGWEARRPHEYGIVNEFGFGFWKTPEKAALSLAV